MLSVVACCSWMSWLLQEHKRVLMESNTEALQFPLRALGRGAALTTAPQPMTAVLHANGGRKGRFL